MKKITLKKLKLLNFKGVRNLEVDFSSDESFIYGANGSGKTTVFDSFVFLLFGKDSTDRKSFEVQTLDKNYNIIPKIEAEVSAVLSVDGERVELTRIMRQKWVKKRGALDSEFTGNETVYEWNGVPMNAGEFTSKINNIIDEKIFKMITNPAAFNSLKWQDQRDVLIDMSGNITDEDVAKGNAEFENLLKNLIGKSFNERKSEVKANILKSKKELGTIPTRIDEVERSKPVGLDFDKLKADLEVKTKAIEAVNDQVSDKLKAQQSDIDAQKEIQNEIYAIENEIQSEKHQLQQKASEAYNEAQSKPREIQRKIDAIDGDIKSNESAISINNSKTSSYGNQIGEISKTIANLRKEWEVENAKEFVMDDSDCACPTCKREFEASDVEEKKKDLQEHFASNKNAKLKSITERGQSLSGQKMTLENNVISLTTELKELQEANKLNWEKRAELSEELKAASNTKTQMEIYTTLLSEKEQELKPKYQAIEDKKEALANRPKVDTSELRSQLEKLNAERDAIKNELQKESQIETSNKRIEQLSKEETTLAQSIADLEKELFTMEAFEKEKSTRIEQSVNNRFRIVNFKLFDTQINGGETPTCKALINGVPFSDANTASKINAGIDIINTLCQHYQVNAPVFIDNRESVVELIPTESQIINLIVSKPDKVLRVENRVEQLETV
ncbi:AAA family ATPase [Winogradskyella forsetii]|uniref:AAA family ATPase n=1 Tax=Winogradskyella forsetii TaxID=2686077 RepID=UPI0015BEBE1B|nr:AAA family ATPase [Winogradskyella forsetii]